MEFDPLEYLFQKVANTALMVTPIISEPAPPSAKPLGSGLYMKLKNDYFLVTAGHLLNLKSWKNLLVPGNNDKMVWLNGMITTTYTDEKEKSNIDFAVLRFSERQVKHLINGQYGFIPPNRILINHKVVQGGYYFIAGYPVSGVKKTAGKQEFIPIPLKLLSYPLKDEKYKQHGFNPEHHILVKYQRKLAPFNSDIKVITKNVTGISGSGLWYVPNWKKNYKGVPEFFLVGIMIEDYRESGFLVALRIDFVTETLLQVFGHNELESTNFKFGDALHNLNASEIL